MKCRASFWTGYQTVKEKKTLLVPLAKGERTLWIQRWCSINDDILVGYISVNGGAFQFGEGRHWSICRRWWGITSRGQRVREEKENKCNKMWTDHPPRCLGSKSFLIYCGNILVGLTLIQKHFNGKSSIIIVETSSRPPGEHSLGALGAAMSNSRMTVLT